MRFPGELVSRLCEDAVTEENKYGPPVRRFAVDDVFIDEYEATNACFSACVEEGSCGEPKPVYEDSAEPGWTDPAYGDHAVRVELQGAEEFCRWRGGRLATALEALRASHGEALHFANSVLFARCRACVDLYDEAACDATELNNLSNRRPVGTWSDDIGPYGHRDLFGGLPDFTSSFWSSPERVCQAPSDSPDPGTFGDNRNPTQRLAYFPYSAAMIPNPYVYQSVGGFQAQWDSPVVATGSVRCAYDPFYEDEGGRP
jgi:formylglycine-generating enzyme required for sulfatase activity